MKNIKKQFFSWKNVLLSSFIMLGIAGIAYQGFYRSGKKEKILNYGQQDKAVVLDLFAKNWYWLVAENVEFSPEYWLDNRAATQYDPADKGKEIIKVLYIGNELAGFVSYHMKKFYLGFVHFLAIDEKYRSKGYGFKLLQSALNDLKKQGATQIYLVTRTINYPAQKIYKRAGFQETSRTNGFVRFDYYV